MKEQTPLVYTLLGVLIGAVAVWFLASNAVNTNNQTMMGMMGMRPNTNTINSNTVDAHFIEQMIPHHEDAITMSEIALEKASDPRVLELAQNIIDSQSREIDQMKIWYKDWFGKDVPQGTQVMGEHGMGQVSEMHMGMMGNETDLRRLEEAEDFDRAFLEEMIPHHQMAVMMANMLKGGTARPEMKQLADDIIEAQTREIELMREWLAN